MRISATGKADPAHTGATGFTLVELLVVLTLIGLMSAAVVIAMPDPGGTLVSEAESFAARVKAAQERAILGSAPVAIRITDAGYDFDQRRGGEWQPIGRDPLIPHEWREGTQALAGEAGAGRIVFDSTGMSDPQRIVLKRGAEQVEVAVGLDGKIHVER